MKGPQKPCCREFLKRKLASILNQGRNLSAELVAARLCGTSERVEFATTDEAKAQITFESVSRSLINHIEDAKRWGTLDPAEAPKGKKKKYEIVVLLRKISG